MITTRWWKNKQEELSGDGHLTVLRWVGKGMKLVEDDKACSVSDNLFFCMER